MCDIPARTKAVWLRIFPKQKICIDTYDDGFKRESAEIPWSNLTPEQIALIYTIFKWTHRYKQVDFAGVQPDLTISYYEFFWTPAEFRWVLPEADINAAYEQVLSILKETANEPA